MYAPEILSTRELVVSMNYTNAEFRNILCGLGYGTFVPGATEFETTGNNSPLTDAYTTESIKKFQREYQLKTNGIADAATRDKARQVMTTLQEELRIVADADIPQNQPYYGPLTSSAVKDAQKQFYPNQKPNGIANLPFRQKLYDEYNKLIPKPSKTQDNWRWCNKCQGLFFAGSSVGGSCPAGGQHNQTGSSNYRLRLENLPNSATQDNWRWCNKCQGLFFGGTAPGGSCPAGGQHNQTDSSNYRLLVQNLSNSVTQENWRWCNKCQGLFFGGTASGGSCPAGGQHNQTGSRNYRIEQV